MTRHRCCNGQFSVTRQQGRTTHVHLFLESLQWCFGWELSRPNRMHSGCGFRWNALGDDRVLCYGQRMSSPPARSLDPDGAGRSEALPSYGHLLPSSGTRSRWTWAVSRYLGRGLLVDARGTVARYHFCIGRIVACVTASQSSDTYWSSSELNGTVYTSDLGSSCIFRRQVPFLLAEQIWQHYSRSCWQSIWRRQEWAE